MNVNPHLQYLQQQQQQQPQQPMNTNVQSPQISQLQLQQQQQQHQLQQQRQQLLNHHLQQQPQQQLGTPNAGHASTSNPLLAAINGNASNQSNGPVNSGSGMSSGQSVNPALQLQLQQLQQHQQQQLFQQQLQGQPTLPAQQQQIPIIKEVWSHNLEHEFHNLRSFINDKSSPVYIAIHQEIPGIVARPVGTFKSSSDYHFQTLRSNSDLLNLIQLSLCVTKVNKNNEIRSSIIWQFNFLYDLTKEMYNEEHLNMLSQTSQINFQLHMTQGIPHFAFAELIIESGLLLDTSINWISYHAGYDLGFLISLLINENLPLDEKEFYWWCSKYFPNFYDLKLIGNQLLNNANNNNNNNNNNTNSNKSVNGNSANNGPSNSVEIPTGGSSGTDASKNNTSNNKPSIEYLAEELHLLPISPAIRQYFASSSNSHFPGQQHQQMTSTLHAYLSMECFKELLRQYGFDNGTLDKFKGVIWGLGSVYGGSSSEITPQNGSASNTTPSTPGSSAKSGVVHFGRPL